MRAAVDRAREAAKVVGDTKKLLLDNDADGDDLMAVATAVGRAANATEPLVEKLYDALIALNDLFRSIPAGFIGVQAYRDMAVTLYVLEGAGHRA